MTRRDRLVKNLLFFSVGTLYLGGYFLINAFTAGRSDLHSLALPFERNLPFIPEMIFAYLLVFVYLAAVYLVVDDLPFFRKVAQAFLCCILIHFLIFLVYPVEYRLRPPLQYDWGGIYRLVAFYYWLDLPYNCFPSMHISNVFLVSSLLNRYRPGWGRFLLPVAGLVAVAVVLVKQHYIADVVAGIVVGWGVYRLTFGSRTSQTKDAPPSPEWHSRP